MARLSRRQTPLAAAVLLAAFIISEELCRSPYAFLSKAVQGSLHHRRRGHPQQSCRRALPDYEKMTVAELKERLRDNGLTLTGRKAVLIQRLQKHEGSSEAPSDGAPSSPYLDDQGLLPDGTYMCLDGKARKGDWERAKRENPDDLGWLTEWVVAARTGQLDKAKKASGS
mmetsp:Transcript_37389/g.69782  ORF Transcript_37389/g.69782 Transcript_37389/m.69782 type:complete len:170 (-) Transcript_37389:189-698(-)